jgi:hypothetical protein
MHAYYRSKGIEYRYFKNRGRRKQYDKTRKGAYKHWELERCLDYNECPLDNGTKSNLKFLIGIRHELEHQMTSQVDEYLSAKLQACAINYDFYITKFFGNKNAVSKELAISIQFAALTPTQRNQLIDSDKLTNNVRNYISEFEDNLTDSELKNTRYAYRVIYTPICVNRKGQADSVIEFVRPDSPTANEIQHVLLKETERVKFLPSEIVKKMQNEGYTKFGMAQHTNLWKLNDMKNQSKGYGTQISKQWYWYEKWLIYVRKHCESVGNRYKAQ